VTLFLHQVDRKLPAERQRMLQAARDRDAALEGRGRTRRGGRRPQRLLRCRASWSPRGDDRNRTQRREAIEALTRSRLPGSNPIEPRADGHHDAEMDGLTAMREIRRQPQ